MVSRRDVKRISRRDYNRILRYVSDEIPIEDVPNGENDRESQLVFNVRRQDWYRIYPNKRRRAKGLYIEIRFPKQFLDEEKIQRGSRQLKRQTGEWLDKSYIDLPEIESRTLREFVDDKISKGYEKLSPELRRRYSLDAVRHMVCPWYNVDSN